MCYDGALVMPQNYTAVSSNEMTYIEGGTTVTKIILNNTEAKNVANKLTMYGYLCAAVGIIASFVALALGIPTAGTATLVAGGIACLFGLGALAMHAAAYAINNYNNGKGVIIWVYHDGATVFWCSLATR